MRLGWLLFWVYVLIYHIGASKYAEGLEWATVVRPILPSPEMCDFCV